MAFKGISCWVPTLAPPSSAFTRKGLASLVGLGGAKQADGAQSKSEMRQARGRRVHGESKAPLGGGDRSQGACARLAAPGGHST